MEPPEESSPVKTLRIDTLLMSCRVIGRTVEEFFFNALLHRARESGYECLLGEFLPTRKNELVANLYERLGFDRQAEEPDGSVTFRLSVSEAAAVSTCIEESE